MSATSSTRRGSPGAELRTGTPSFGRSAPASGGLDDDAGGAPGGAPGPAGGVAGSAVFVQGVLVPVVDVEKEKEKECDALAAAAA